MSQFPVELVHELMSAVRQSTDSRSAAKTYFICAQVNRAWHGAAIRFLWSDIHLPSLSHAEECLRSIQRYPRNARFTRNLTFNGGTLSRDPTKPEVQHMYNALPHALSTVFTNLQTLTVDNATISIATIASFFNTSTSITSLSVFHWTGLVDETSNCSTSHITALQSGISRLRHIKAGAPGGTPCHIYNDDEKSFLTYLTSNASHNLRSFSFASFYKNYIDQCIEPLSEQTCGLESISLERAATDAAILPIIRSSPNLKSVHLNGTRATDAVVEALVESCPEVRELGLGYSYVTDRALGSLSSPEAPMLSSLDLTNTYLTEEAFIDYIKGKGKDLKRLMLKENRWVTEKTLRAIEEHASGIDVLEVDELVWMGLCRLAEGSVDK